MTRLEFGKPKTDAQAIIRLPDNTHPDYRIPAGPIEHLVHFKTVVEDILSRDPNTISEIDRDLRWIPLGVEDMRLLERTSFWRDLENAITIRWEFVPLDSNWAGHLDYDDDHYRWWQITEMKPGLGDSGLKLVCVESSEDFSGAGKYRFKENSDFDIFILTSEEFDSLVQELTRNAD